MNCGRKEKKIREEKGKVKKIHHLKINNILCTTQILMEKVAPLKNGHRIWVLYVAGLAFWLGWRLDGLVGVLSGWYASRLDVYLGRATSGLSNKLFNETGCWVTRAILEPITPVYFSYIFSCCQEASAADARSMSRECPVDVQSNVKQDNNIKADENVLMMLTDDVGG